MIDMTGPAIAALVAMGMAIAFMHADPDSPTSRALALTLAAVGVSIVANVTLRNQATAGHVPLWAGPAALIDMAGFMAGYEWIRRIRRTIPAGQLRTRFGDSILWLAQGLAVVYGALGLALPELRVTAFLGGLFNDGWMLGRDFLLFALPLEVGLGLAGVSVLLCLNRRPDPAERVRLVAFMIGTPFIASGLVLPFPVAPLATVAGLLILLIGAMRYHVMQGRQGLFLGRFLSPQVASMVRRSGLRSAMADSSYELSIVCCDLRGFTRYAQQNSSDRVIGLLRDYYDAVGEAVTEFEGTIKDYAGDGVLVLIGAPLPRADHAARAVRLAEAIVRRWRRTPSPLSIGVGVASGKVTVGIVGGEGRLEYAAVGSAVNLAARLCDEAAPGQILVAPDTVAAIGEAARGNLVPAPPLRLKGFAEEVPTFALTPA